MHFETFYLRCLAQASYLVGDGGQCAIVDPRRDVDLYLQAAAARGLTITHVIETHLHADFVSGHVELAARTGATIHVGAAAGARYPHHAVHDGDEIAMGRVRLRFLETPGHTPESLCVLVFDGDGGHPVKVFTGDTLFIGDVGRPDLVGSKGRTAEEMARLLYDSLHHKLLALPDDVEVHPAHGAGSACGKSISSELSSTIGAQRATNYALAPMDREAFVRLVTAGLPPAPPYFPASAELNREGAPALAELPSPPPLARARVEALQQQGAIVLDVRPAAEFGAGHLPGSVNIGLDGQFASWVGTVLPVGSALVLVAGDEARLAEARLRLARVGYHDVRGFVEGGVEGFSREGAAVGVLPQIAPAELAARLAGKSPRADAPGTGGSGTPLVLDVRRPAEHEAGHVAGALHVPLHELQQRAAEVEAFRRAHPGRPLAVVCAGGYRSSIAASLLLRGGMDDLLNVTGGMNAWRAAGLPEETSVPASAG